ncbi:tetratricopeptide repeat protein [Fodinibius sp.]|uniref:tetratricopeptide repeat protein n=1 Tax=Fodinibius sp. TaxID=1872440 RepID=UPI0035660EAD
MKKLLLLTAFIFFSSSWTMAQSSQEPPSGMSEIQAYSIFYENYKNESYEEALQFGRWIWKGMPETIEGYPKFDLKRNLRRLITVYSNLGENIEDPSLAEAYTDTALTIFDKVYETYGDDLDAYEWAVRRGRFYESHSDRIEDAATKAAAEYKKAFDLKPEEFTKMGDGYYVQSMLRDLISQDKKEEALAIIDEAEPYAPEKLNEYFSKARNKLFDTPEERITFLKGELEDDPENEELLTQLQDIYEREDMVSELNAISKKLYEINPSYENSLALAESAQSDANYNEAIEYFKEALDKAEKSDQKAAIALNISSAYLNSEQLPQAREYARIAADHDSEWGKPFINIADAYAQAVSNCTDNRKLEVEDRVVYWLVLDYLNKAKSIDSSVSSEANNKINSYASVTPTTEQQFFKNWDEGQQLSVDESLNSCYGWINETTTVRR